eukprot:2300363-Pyramimonas_sp.AAC.2
MGGSKGVFRQGTRHLAASRPLWSMVSTGGSRLAGGLKARSGRSGFTSAFCSGCGAFCSGCGCGRSRPID